MAGKQEGDWMQISKDDGLDPSNPEFSMHQQPGIDPIAKGIEKVPDVIMSKPNIKRKVRIKDLTTAEAKAKAWFVVHGEVSDYFLPRAVPIYAARRSDMAVVMSKHIMAGRTPLCSSLEMADSSDAEKKLAEFHIGTLIKSYKMVPQVNISNDDSQEFLNPRVGKKVVVSSLNACREMPSVSIRFALPNPEQPLGLPFGQRIYLRFHTNTKNPMILNEAGTKELYAPDPERLHGTSQVSLIFRENCRRTDLRQIYRPTSKSPLSRRKTDKLSVDDEVEVKGPAGYFIWKR